MPAPFHFKDRDIIGLMEYRIACCAADEEGSVISDGEVLAVNRFGVMKKEPAIMDEWFHKIETLLRMQIEKRKMERDFGRSTPQNTL